MNIFLVSNPKHASTEESLLTNSGGSPKTEDGSTNSFEAALGASSPTTPRSPILAAKKGDGKNAAFTPTLSKGNLAATPRQHAATPAPQKHASVLLAKNESDGKNAVFTPTLSEGNLAAAPRQRTATTAPQTGTSRGAENSEPTDIGADVADGGDTGQEVVEEDSKTESDQRITRRVQLPVLEINQATAQLVIAELPKVEISLIPIVPVSGSGKESLQAEASQDRLIDGINSSGQNDRSHPEVIAPENLPQLGSAFESDLLKSSEAREPRLSTIQLPEPRTVRNDFATDRPISPKADAATAQLRAEKTIDQVIKPSVELPVVQAGQPSSSTIQLSEAKTVRNDLGTDRPISPKASAATAQLRAEKTIDQVIKPSVELPVVQAGQPSLKTSQMRAGQTIEPSSNFDVGQAGQPTPTATNYPEAAVVTSNAVAEQSLLTKAHSTVAQFGNQKLADQAIKPATAEAAVEVPSTSEESQVPEPRSAVENSSIPDRNNLASAPLDRKTILHKSNPDSLEQPAGIPEAPVEVVKSASPKRVNLPLSNPSRPSRTAESPMAEALRRSPVMQSVAQFGIAARQAAILDGRPVGSTIPSEAQVDALSSGILQTGVLGDERSNQRGQPLGNSPVLTRNTHLSSQNSTQRSSKNFSPSVDRSSFSAIPSVQDAAKAEIKRTTSVSLSPSIIAPEVKTEIVPLATQDRSAVADASSQNIGYQRQVASSIPRRSSQELGNPNSASEPSRQALSQTDSSSAIAKEVVASPGILAEVQSRTGIPLTEPKPSEVSDSGKKLRELPQLSSKPETVITKGESKPGELKVGIQTKADSVNQSSMTSTSVHGPTILQSAEPLTPSNLKLAEQPNRDLNPALERPLTGPDAGESRSSEDAQFGSSDRGKDESAMDAPSETVVGAQESKDYSSATRRNVDSGIESTEVSSVSMRAHLLERQAAVSKSHSSRGGTVDAEQGSAMALRANSETGIEMLGKNVPSVGNIDSALRPYEPTLSSAGSRLVMPELISQRVQDASAFYNLSSNNEGQKVSEPGAMEFGESVRVAAAKLVDHVWSAVEKFHATSQQDWVVSIRPDRETHLNLKLKLQDNQVHVHATLESGNWGAVAPHWPELQAVLAERGIQLKPLEAGSGQNSLPQQQLNQFGSGGNEHRQTTADRAYAREFLDLTRDLARPSAEPQKTATTRTSSRPNQVLETWA